MYRIFACLLPLIVAISSGHSAPKLKEETSPFYYPTGVGFTRVLIVRISGLKYETLETVEATERKDGYWIVTVVSGGREWSQKFTRYRVSRMSVSFFSDRGNSGQASDPSVCFLRLPAKAGDSWECPSPYGGPDRKCTYKTIGEEEVEVPAGKFRAVRVEGEEQFWGTTYRVTRWFVPGLGAVKTVTVWDDKEKVEELKTTINRSSQYGPGREKQGRN